MNKTVDLPKRIGLLCCRGGSKGIPGKNIKSFAGEPLLCHVSKAALESNIFDKVLLSTDCEKIAKVGLSAGLHVPFLRPVELAGDASDQFEAHKHAFEVEGFDDSNCVICVLNNSPFTSAEMIISSFNLFRKNGYTRVVADAVEVGADFYPHRLFKQSSNPGLTPANAKSWRKAGINRQNYDVLFSPLFNLRWGQPSWLSSFESFKMEILKNGLDYIEVPKARAYDIDTKDDWYMAENVFRGLEMNGGQSEQS